MYRSFCALGTDRGPGRKRKSMSATLDCMGIEESRSDYWRAAQFKDWEWHWMARWQWYDWTDHKLDLWGFLVLPILSLIATLDAPFTFRTSENLHLFEKLDTVLEKFGAHCLDFL
jgi:hypothetical protein